MTREDRKALAERYEKWRWEKSAPDTPEFCISFLQENGLIKETMVRKLLKSGD